MYVAGDGGRAAPSFVALLQRTFPKAAIIGGIAQGAFSRSPGGAVEYSDDCVVVLAMAGNVPLQALVSRGARPLGGAHVVTACEPVTTRAGTELLMLEKCRPVGGDDDDDDEDENEGGLGASDEADDDPSVMNAFESAYRAMDNSGMGMLYIGVKKVTEKKKKIEGAEEDDDEDEKAEEGVAQGYMLYDLSNEMLQQGALVIPDPYCNEADDENREEGETRNDRRMAAWKSKSRYLGGKLQFRVSQ